MWASYASGRRWKWMQASYTIVCESALPTHLVGKSRVSNFGVCIIAPLTASHCPVSWGWHRHPLTARLRGVLAPVTLLHTGLDLWHSCFSSVHASPLSLPGAWPVCKALGCFDTALAQKYQGSQAGCPEIYRKQKNAIVVQQHMPLHFHHPGRNVLHFMNTDASKRALPMKWFVDVTSS